MDLLVTVVQPETLFAPIFGPAATFLCKHALVAAPAQEQRDPTNPDLQVRLAAGSAPAYATDVVRAVTVATFAEQPFVVPTDVIPGDGLRLEVVDDDAADGAEVIGAVRLTRTEILAALGGPALVRQDPTGSASLEIVVAAYAPRPPATIPMDAKQGTLEADSVLAGEVVRVRATGGYKVGSWYDAHVAPAGYPGGGPTRYNFKYEPLKSAAHACAFFLVGERRRMATLVTPCGASLATFSGPLVLGINDDDPANNSGAITYSIERRAPTVDEWQRHRIAQDDCR